MQANDDHITSKDSDSRNNDNNDSKNNNNAVLARRHQVCATQVNSLQTGWF